MQSLKALPFLFSEGTDPTSRYVLIAITLSCCCCCCFGGSNNSRSSQSISEKGKRQAGKAASKFARLYKLHKHTHTRAHRNAHTHTRWGDMVEEIALALFSRSLFPAPWFFAWGGFANQNLLFLFLLSSDG